MFPGCLAKICGKCYYKLKRQEVEATRESCIMGGSRNLYLSCILGDNNRQDDVGETHSTQGRFALENTE